MGYEYQLQLRSVVEVTLSLYKVPLMSWKMGKLRVGESSSGSSLLNRCKCKYKFFHCKPDEWTNTKVQNQNEWKKWVKILLIFLWKANRFLIVFPKEREWENCKYDHECMLISVNNNPMFTCLRCSYCIKYESTWCQ